MKKRIKKGILINVEERTLTYVYLKNNTEIYKHIGNNCSDFECPISFENDDTIYCDGEGRFRNFKGGFIMNGWEYPILGNGVILGSSIGGEGINCATRIEDIKSKIKFISFEGNVIIQNRYISTPICR